MAGRNSIMLYSICRRVPPLQEWYFEYWYHSPMDTFCDSVAAYISNRWVTKAHLVRLPQVKKGTWMETDEVMFHAVFQLLVEFVEGQAAHCVKISEDPDNEVYAAWKKTNTFKRWLNRRHWNELFGKAYLANYINDTTDPDHAVIAAKTLSLYNWYKHERPTRPKPFKGFTGQKVKNGVWTPEFDKWLNEQAEKEAYFYADDTRKAQHVLDIRSSLWT